MSSEHEDRSAGAAAADSFLAASDRVLHALGHGKDMIAGLSASDALSALATAHHLGKAIDGALRGEYEQMQDHLIEMANAAYSAGTAGVWGVFEAGFDASAALQRAVGIDAPTLSQTQAEAARAIENSINSLLQEHHYAQHPEARPGFGAGPVHAHSSVGLGHPSVPATGAAHQSAPSALHVPTGHSSHLGGHNHHHAGGSASTDSGALQLGHLYRFDIEHRQFQDLGFLHSDRGHFNASALQPGHNYAVSIDHHDMRDLASVSYLGHDALGAHHFIPAAFPDAGIGEHFSATHNSALHDSAGIGGTDSVLDPPIFFGME
jgi:hypothetical protein